ncbi:MAG: polyprenyl synthetase family protein [Fimbriimonadales bacterium]|nr:polyprenyl synthetase family protein [Fimbriimonadales bacterium]
MKLAPNLYIDAVREVIGEAFAEQLIVDLQNTEVQIQERLPSRSKTATQISEHILLAGWKRLRPLAVIACARSGPEFPAPRVYRIAACMEMIHMATLIHDDVIDQAPTRRGLPTPGVLWGNTAAILAGDVLLSRAMQTLAEDGDLRLILLAARAVGDMAEGEVRETEMRGNYDLSVEEHLETLRLKTASFLSACCQMGAVLGDCDPKAQEALGEYGANLGLAFQIVDDLLDFVGDTRLMGKPRATDFREGVPTLPFLLLRQELTESEHDYVKNIFGNGVSDEEAERICQWVWERGVAQNVLNHAKSFALRALCALDDLPDSQACKALRALTDFVVNRTW